VADDPRLRQAELIRAACLEAATRAYEQASISGLCGEGAWEVARAAIERLDVEKVIRDSLKKIIQDADQ